MKHNTISFQYDNEAIEALIREDLRKKCVSLNSGDDIETVPRIEFKTAENWEDVEPIVAVATLYTISDD